MGVALLAALGGWVAGAVVGRDGRPGGRAPWVDGPRGRDVGLLVAALVAALAGGLLRHVGLPVGAANTFGVLLAVLLAAGFLLRNRTLPGAGLLTAGLLLNGLVIAVNGAMPVSAYAAVRAGVSAHVVDDGRHEPADRHTRLSWLADVVPAPLPGRAEVVSIGDLLVGAALGQFAFAAARARQDGRGARRSPPTRHASAPRRARHRARRPVDRPVHPSRYEAAGLVDLFPPEVDEPARGVRRQSVIPRG